LTQALQDGEQYINAKRFAEAVTEYATAAELDADNPFSLPNIYTQQCNAYVQLRKGTEALEACNKALSLEDGRIDALLYRAEAHIILENLDGAQSDFQNVANREPNNHRAREGMQRVQRLIKIASRKNYYQILGITKEANSADVRKAYRKMALEFHPVSETTKIYTRDAS
jgi:DnaJ family protein C protein 3